MSIILFWAVIASGSFFCACLGKKTEIVFPVTCMMNIMLLYFMGLVLGLKVGFCFLMAVSVILYAGGIYLICFKNKWDTFKQNFFTKSSIIILFFLIFFLWCDVGMRGGKAVDDFSHWMHVVKQMSRLDDFGTNPLAEAGYGYYPPGMALFQYIFQKLYLIGKSSFCFSEWRCHYAYHMLMIFVICPFLKPWAGKKIWQPLIWMFTLIMLPTVFYFAYIDLSVETILAFMTGAGFARILLEKEKDLLYRVYICLDCATLAILKDAGIMMALFLALAFIIDEAVVKYADTRKDKQSRFRSAFFGACLVMGSVAVPKMLWNWEVNNSGIQRYFSATVDLRELLNVLVGNDNSYKTDVVKNFIGAFFEKTIYIDWAGEANQPHLPVTYFALMLIIFLLLSVVCMIHANVNHAAGMTKYKIIGVVLGGLYVVWIIGLLVTYLTNFSEVEAVQLASFGRYIHVVYLILAIVILLVLADIICGIQNHATLMLGITFIIGVLIAPRPYMVKWISREWVRESYAQRVAYDCPSRLIREFCNSEDRILMIYQFAWNYPYHVNRFELCPMDISWKLFTQDSESNGDFRDFGEFDYVVIQRNDEYFIGTYAGFFDGPIEENVIYKVDNNKSKLIRMN